MITTAANAIERLHHAFSERVAEGLENLFQTKHLYQSVTIDFTDFINAALKDTGVSGTILKIADHAFKGKLVEPWVPAEEIVSDPTLKGDPCVITPDVKLFCEICGRIEPFNSLSTKDSLRFATGRKNRFQTKRGLIQVFIFSFLCQGCKIVPEVFIVRRENFKLTLCGRAPIEHIDVPNVIPKQVQNFYSGALLAYQSGQTLAGNFLLRTLIEQWVQFMADEKPLQADVAIDRYMEQLPTDFKSRFPSLRTLYSDLSSDIHMATGSDELFEKAKAQIGEHYEARRLFKLN